MKNSINLSVIIVNYNVRHFLETCILSIIEASKNMTVEIIVIDNNSSDDSCKVLKKTYPEVKLIKNKKNYGFSTANNQGVKIAKGEYLLVLNPDTIVAEDTFEKLITLSKSRINLGIIGVKLVDGSGNFLPESKRGIPTPKVSFNKLFRISSKQTGKYYATHLEENESGIVDVLVGAFMFLKKSVYNEVNGFDEDYFMYGEDIDLCYKILNKGYQNYYFSNTQVIHFKGESTKKDIKYLRFFHKAMKIFYKKHFKLNIIYDSLMSFGIEAWFLLKYFQFLRVNENKIEINNVLYLGDKKEVISYLDKNYLLINESLIGNFEQIKYLLKNEKIDCIIFENNLISFKDIISHMEILKDEGVSFKIHPKYSKFLIGSVCSKKQGKVEILSNN